MCFSDGLEKDAVTSQACLDALLHFAADGGPGGGCGRVTSGAPSEGRPKLGPCAGSRCDTVPMMGVKSMDRSPPRSRRERQPRRAASLVGKPHGI